MQFLIADTFTDSLGRLTGDEQKAVKQTAFDLQVNPANPGMQFHRLSNSKDKDFWSARVTDDIRLVVHKTAGSLLLCYVDHHDKAYRWAERRKLETHPKTGAVQFVEVRERIEEIRVPKYVDEPVEEPPVIEVKESRTPLFGQFTDDELLGYGVPPDWVSATREVNDDTALLSLIEHLPQEASEALLELATGGKPEIRTQLRVGASPFSHPDSRRRFQIVTDVDELRRALDFPWDKWTVFLHPDQRELVERDYTGPAKVSGSAGTGKTIVALHRAVFLARQNPESRVLLATFTDALANALHGRLKRLISNEPQIGERLDVRSLNAVGVRLYRQRFGEPKLLTRERLAQYVRDVAYALPPTKFSQAFLAGEWWEIVAVWQLGGWESYRD